MKRLSVAMLVLIGAATVAQAYPLYWIGIQIRGTSWTWLYSGRNSSGGAFSSTHASAASARIVISETFKVFAKGQPKDAAGRACSTLAFTEGTQTNTRRLDPTDGRNVMGVFVTQDRDPIYQYMQGGAVAFATPYPDDQGYVADCDTVFNAKDVEFATDGSTTLMDLQRVAMQETAHCFGLHHVCEQSPGDGQPPCDGPDVDFDSVMFPFAFEGNGADTPNGRDLDNMCQIYPVNGIGRPCDDRREDTPGGPSGFTAPDCAEGTECGCTPVGAICTKGCDSNADCPTAARCEAGYCVPNFYPNTQNIGEATRFAETCGGTTVGSDQHDIGVRCRNADDCGPADTCISQVPGGYCTMDCRRDTCPRGSACVGNMVTSTDALCVKSCTLDRTTCGAPECAPGHQCQPFGENGAGVCWKPCKRDRDCDPSGRAGILCDLDTATCYRRGRAPSCEAPACTRLCEGVVCGKSDGCDGVCDDLDGCVEPGVPDAGPRPVVDAGTPGSGGDAPGGCDCASGAALAPAILGVAVWRRRRDRAIR